MQPPFGPNLPALNSDSRSTDAGSANEDETGVTPCPSTVSVQSHIRFVLDNFFIAMSLISFVILIIFTVIWLAVLRDATAQPIRELSNSTGLSILGDSLQLDLEASVLSVSWNVLVCGASTSSKNLFRGTRVLTHCKPPNKALDIYLNDSSKPIFSSVPHTEPMSKRLGVWDPPRFTVEHRFNKHGGEDSTENPVDIFQHYNFNAFLLAIDPAMNHSVHIAMFGILGTLGDFDIRSRDAADTSEFIYDSGKGPVTTEVESRVLQVEITRSAISKAFAVCLFIANWVLTVGSVYITALVASRMLEANSIVATFPFSAPLTIPTVRSLYINSPPLGTCVDTVAFFVQIAIVGLCCLVLFGVLTSCRSPPSPSSELSV